MFKKVLLSCSLMLAASIANADKPSNAVTFLKTNDPSIQLIHIDDHKTIKRYPSATRVMEMNVMTVNGRSPINLDHFIYNASVHFMIYVTKGKGIFYVDDMAYATSEGDVLDVPPKTRFAVNGVGLEYVTVENPAFFQKQSYIVDSKGNVVSN